MNETRYWCMACPATFGDADTANAHHDATGHNQTHREPRQVHPHTPGWNQSAPRSTPDAPPADDDAEWRFLTQPGIPKHVAQYAIDAVERAYPNVTLTTERLIAVLSHHLAALAPAAPAERPTESDAVASEDTARLDWMERVLRGEVSMAFTPTLTLGVNDYQNPFASKSLRQIIDESRGATPRERKDA